MVQDTVTTTTSTMVTVGLDLSDRDATYVVVGTDGVAGRPRKVALERGRFRRWAASCEPSRFVLEAGSQSAWVERALAEVGHEVVVADPRRLPLISRSRKKNDRTDAEALARLGRSEPELLNQVHQRDEGSQQALSVVRARALLVAQRTQVVNHLRATVKGFGFRLSGGLPKFPAQLAELPVLVQRAVAPLVTVAGGLSEQIAAYDHEVERLVEEEYPQAKLLRQVPGVGALTALTFVLTVGDPDRFRKARLVGAYLGLTPRQRQSGRQDPQLRISKAGDSYLRTLLVQCAHWTLGPFAKESALRAFGQRLSGQGRGNQKKRAVVAVARKLAVVLLMLWKTGSVYEAWPGRQEVAMA